MALAAKTRSKIKPTEKKRHARHHKHSKHYLKTYWPYIPMLIVVGLGLVINSVWSHSAVLGASSNFSSQALLDNTNTQRAQDNEGNLAIDPLLTKAAQAKANDMVARNYWSHDTPDGNSPWTFISAAGYNYQLAGENLAYGFNNASSTISGWMNSPEHKANILNGNYSQVGFGVASSPNFQGSGPETIIVAMYATPAAAAANFTFTVPNPSTGTVLGSHKSQPSAQPVSRVQILTDGNAPWSVALVSALAGGALALFIVRHGLRLRKILIKGELFVAHHPALDFAIVSIFTVGFLLTRTSGFIR